MKAFEPRPCSARSLSLSVDFRKLSISDSLLGSEGSSLGVFGLEREREVERSTISFAASPLFWEAFWKAALSWRRPWEAGRAFSSEVNACASMLRSA
eukprot:scaffold78403_cov30-Tisochrysis_lutea.AAC.6